MNDKNNKKIEDPGACFRCAKNFGTCCIIKPEQIHYCFPLSIVEKAQISAFLSSDYGAVKEKNSQDFIRSIQKLFPGEGLKIQLLFPTNSFHWRLQTDTDGACVFLTETGCKLPREIRPAYCLIFPFWVLAGRISHFSFKECQALRESFNLAGLRKTFAVTDEDIFTLYNTVRKLWGLTSKKYQNTRT